MTLERDELVAELAKISRQVSTQTVLLHHRIARELGLGPTDHKALDLITDAGGMTPSRLAAETGLSSGAVTTLIDRLEQRGFVHRAPSAGDRRSVTVLPVDPLPGVIEPAFGALLESWRALLGGFSDNELRTIERYQRVLLAAMTREVDATARP